MHYGSMPADAQNLLLTPEAAAELLKQEPILKQWLLRYVGSKEFINGIERYCLWLVQVKPEVLRSSKNLLERADAVRIVREASTSKPVRLAAQRPLEFYYIAQPNTRYIAVPEVSSGERYYIPIGVLEPTVIASNKLYLIDKFEPYTFGILSSLMHMAWTRSVTGRLKSDYQYSATMVYNNFPWPVDAMAKQKEAIEKAAQAVLDTREKFPGSSLADLYDPLTMPPELLKAHQTLDKAVDAAYGKRSFTTEADRVAFLFEQYQKLASPLVSEEKPKKKTKLSKA